VPLRVVRQHAQKNVRPHMILDAVVNGANPQVDPLQAAERTLHLRQSLVAADRVLGRAAALEFAGAHHGDTIQSRCAPDRLFAPAPRKPPLAMVSEEKCLPTLKLPSTRPAFNAISASPSGVRVPRFTSAAIFSKSFSLVPISSCRLRRSSSASSGLKQATSEMSQSVRRSVRVRGDRRVDRATPSRSSRLNSSETVKTGHVRLVNRSETAF
jgi:hypothetical protein